MGRRPFLWLAALALGACTDAGPDDAGTGGLPPSTAPTQVYLCGDDRVVARPEGETVRLVLPDKAVILPQVPAASGARYVAGGFSFWSKGEVATIETPSRHWPECHVVPGEGPWADAALRGIDFRAFGHEPGWVVEIDRGRTIFVLADYGERRIQVPDSDPPDDGGARPVVHRGQADGHEVTVTIEAASCVEPSGRTQPATVALLLDGDAYQGCGRFLD